MRPGPITGATRVFALVGHPVAHSLSPALHNAWLHHAGLDAVYVALPCPDPAPDLCERLRALGLAGANLTLPHKVVALTSLARLGDAARDCGAVNTLTLDPAGAAGFNTDAHGLCACLDELATPLADQHAIVLGAGGAARAAVWALRARGIARFTLFNRTRASARATLDHLGVEGTVEALDPRRFRAVAPSATIVINTLPGPARAAVRDLPVLALPAHAAWIDLNYWDAEPPHLRALAASGHPVQRGDRLLLHQAALAFTHFTGLTPDLDRVRALISAPSVR